jgi:aminopeptidase N
MIHTLLGAAGFRKGMDLYFQRHDNDAVTIEDFVQAMQDASGIDLHHFKLWYVQAGTPEIWASDSYDPTTRRYTLTLRQSTAPTPGQKEKLPLLIPVAMGLLDGEGAPLPTRLEGENQALTGTRVLSLEETEQSFVFEDVPGPPVPSLLRGFSAPVNLRDVPLGRLRFLAAHDTDPFARWDAGQQFATRVLLDMVAAYKRGDTLVMDDGLVAAVRATLGTAEADPAFAAEAMVLPAESFLMDQMTEVDVDAIHAVRRFARGEIGAALWPELLATYHRLADDGPYRTDGAAIGRRALRNTCLAYMAATGGDEAVGLAKRHFDAGANMTDVLAALGILAEFDRPERDAALAAFYDKWRHDELVMDKWFSIQSTSSLPGTIDAVRALIKHPDFDMRNPNRVRAVVGSFAMANQVRFHDAGGAGYAFLADQIIALDPNNSQMAARMTGPLGAWRRQDAGRQALMKDALRRILAQPNLSKGTFEMASKSLA